MAWWRAAKTAARQPGVIDGSSLADALQRDGAPLVVDVRTEAEFRQGHIPGAVGVPLHEIDTRLHELPKDRDIVCVCRSGHRSAIATSRLRGHGFRALNLTGGMLSFAASGRCGDRLTEVFRVEALRHTVTTNKSVDRAASDVAAALADRRFSVLWDLNLNTKLQEKGLDLKGDFRVLEVCSAPRAKAALEANPLVAYLLPCKVVVYERDGRTEIGLPRPTTLMGLIGDPSLAPLAEEVERALVEAVDAAAG